MFGGIPQLPYDNFGLVTNDDLPRWPLNGALVSSRSLRPDHDLINQSAVKVRQDVYATS